MIRYIDEHRNRFGVEAICRVLNSTACGFITARGYRAAKQRARSIRSIRDEQLTAVLVRLHREHFSVYGVRKMHALLVRKGWAVGRDGVARLMRKAGLVGVRRGKRVFTTHSDRFTARPADLVARGFTAQGPNQIWVADMTYVSTWAGMAYVAFLTDVFSRRIVGWSVKGTMTTAVLPLEAWRMATWRTTDLDGLIHHSDAGAQYVSLRYTQALADVGARPSVGTVGDSYDNALAETINGLYKAELVHRRRPWRTVEQLELATSEWVYWYNTTRLHSYLGYRSPAEYERDHYDHQQPLGSAPAAPVST